MPLKFLLLGIERVSITKKGIFWFYIPNLIFSIFFSLFITFKIDKILAGTAEGEVFYETLGFSFLVHLISVDPDLGSTIKILIAISLPIFFLINLFLSGGSIKVLSREWRSYDFKYFLSGCYDFFFRFVRLFVLSIFFYLLPYLFLKHYLLPYFEKVYEVEEVKLIFTKSLIYIFSFVLFAFINVVFDITKVRIVAKNSASVLSEFLYTFFYTLRNFSPVMILYFLTFFLNLIPFVLYLVSSYFLFSSYSFFFIFLNFLIFQLILLTRVWIKFVFWSSQRELWLYIEGK